MNATTLILASGSPRRAMLLEALGFPFAVEPTHASEDLPDGIPASEAASMLARRKAHAHPKSGDDRTVILAADTVVISDGMILNKPGSADEAFQMLSSLSGKTHDVITGVCMVRGREEFSSSDSSQVTFRNLTPGQVQRYIADFKPLDKAGAYGIQESLPDDMHPASEAEKELMIRTGRTNLLERCRENTSGRKPVVLIQGLEGPFFNVMGLPLTLIEASLRLMMRPR